MFLLGLLKIARTAESSTADMEVSDTDSQSTLIPDTDSQESNVNPQTPAENTNDGMEVSQTLSRASISYQNNYVQESSPTKHDKAESSAQLDELLDELPPFKKLQALPYMPEIDPDHILRSVLMCFSNFVWGFQTCYTPHNRPSTIRYLREAFESARNNENQEEKFLQLYDHLSKNGCLDLSSNENTPIEQLCRNILTLIGKENKQNTRIPKEFRSRLSIALFDGEPTYEHPDEPKSQIKRIPFQLVTSEEEYATKALKYQQYQHWKSDQKHKGLSTHGYYRDHPNYIEGRGINMEKKCKNSIFFPLRNISLPRERDFMGYRDERGRQYFFKSLVFFDHKRKKAFTAINFNWTWVLCGPDGIQEIGDTGDLREFKDIDIQLEFYVDEDLKSELK